jgi:hypothetical protein
VEKIQIGKEKLFSQEKMEERTEKNHCFNSVRFGNNKLVGTLLPFPFVFVVCLLL